jgi:DNA (cytosine-5)-methyltransferase 1
MGAVYSEKDRHCAAWLRNLEGAGFIAAGHVDDRDVRDLCAADLAGYGQVHLFAGIGLWSRALRLAGWSDDPPLWTVSCPCQPFSAAGRGGGIFDDRHIWPAAHWLIGQCRPVTILGEQVASPDGLAWFDIVSADLEALGYTCGTVDFPSAGVGAPNIRQRLFWVAVADSQRWGEARGDHAATGDDLSGRGIAVGRLGYATRGRSSTRPSIQDARHCQNQPDGSGASCWLGDPSQQRLPDTEPQDLCGAWRRTEGGAAPEPSGPCHPWRELEWLTCLDRNREGRRRVRPTQPGIFPLAPRYPGDVAKLRAYGSAINPVAAAHVIRAFMACID